MLEQGSTVGATSQSSAIGLFSTPPRGLWSVSGAFPMRKKPDMDGLDGEIVLIWAVFVLLIVIASV